MTVWVMTFNGEPVAHYQDHADAFRDASEMRYNMGSRCPAIEIVKMKWGFYG